MVSLFFSDSILAVEIEEKSVQEIKESISVNNQSSQKVFVHSPSDGHYLVPETRQKIRGFDKLLELTPGLSTYNTGVDIVSADNKPICFITANITFSISSGKSILHLDDQLKIVEYKVISSNEEKCKAKFVMYPVTQDLVLDLLIH